jgi:hypothetical protein
MCVIILIITCGAFSLSPFSGRMVVVVGGETCGYYNYSIDEFAP